MWTDFMHCCQMNKCDQVTKRGVLGGPHTFLHIVQGVAQNKGKVIVTEIRYEFLFIILRSRPAGLAVVKTKLRIINMFISVDMGTVFT